MNSVIRFLSNSLYHFPLCLNSEPTIKAFAKFDNAVKFSLFAPEPMITGSETLSLTSIKIKILM